MIVELLDQLNDGDSEVGFLERREHDVPITRAPTLNGASGEFTENFCAIEHWPVPNELLAAKSTEYRNSFATALSTQHPDDIVQRYVYLSVDEMEELVQIAEQRLLGRSLHGDGIELGAGCGLLSAIAARRPGVNSIFALEICQRMAELVLPKVSQHVAGAWAAKVTPVVGSFDDLQLDDNSLDFAIEIDSLHHSDDLTKTLSECARVLKPDAPLLCFDRCHPDSVTDQQVKEMLAVVYSPDFLTFNHYPPDTVLTRRDNGEHEYRLFEWESAFRDSGLQLVRKCELLERISTKAAVKGLLSKLPHRSEE